MSDDKTEKKHTKQSARAPERQVIDNTDTLYSTDRRLDALAQILCSHSICTAVVNINGKIYITANELSEKSRDNNTRKSIEEALGYLKELEYDEETREAFFRKICTSQRLKNIVGAKSTPVMPDSIAEDTIKIVLKEKYKDITLKTLMERFKADLPTALLALGTWINLFRNLKKMEVTIEQALAQDEESIDKKPKKEEKENLLTEDEKTIFKDLVSALSEKTESLLLEKNRGVHAEVQLLAHIVDLLEKKEITGGEFYIGISRRCCLECEKTIEAANQIFQKDGVLLTIQTRGSHGQSFGGWVCPENFSVGYNENKEPQKSNPKASDKKNIGYRIGHLAKSLIEKAKTEKRAPSGEPMHYDLSDSDIESVTSATHASEVAGLKAASDQKKENLILYISQLQESVRLDDAIDIKDILAQNEMLRAIHESSRFKDLFEYIEFDDPKGIFSRLDFIARVVTITHSADDTAGLVKVYKMLTSSSFFTPETAEYFKKCESILKDQVIKHVIKVNLTSRDLDSEISKDSKEAMRAAIEPDSIEKISGVIADYSEEYLPSISVSDEKRSSAAQGLSSLSSSSLSSDPSLSRSVSATPTTAASSVGTFSTLNTSSSSSSSNASSYSSTLQEQEARSSLASVAIAAATLSPVPSPPIMSPGPLGLFGQRHSSLTVGSGPTSSANTASTLTALSSSSSSSSSSSRPQKRPRKDPS